MKTRNIDVFTQLGRRLIKNNRRDDLSATETAKLLQTAAAGDTDDLIKAISAAFYMGYAVGYKRRDTEPPQGETEILFTISNAEAAELDAIKQLEGIADLNADEYAKLLLIMNIHPEQTHGALLNAIRTKRQ